MSVPIVKHVKTQLKTRLKQLRRLYHDSFHSFSVDDFSRSVAALGVGAGDILLVHSSFDAFAGFNGKPTDVISTLQNLTGPEGAVLMPTLPFGGTAVEYVRQQPVFDVRRTPSRMGLVTELFRRSTGVIRSVHPTHSVAVWGRDAAALAEGHHAAKTPCGICSPYARLLEMHGKIVFLGTGIDTLTFFHTVEELIEKRLPFSPFTEEVFHLQSRDHSGKIVATQTRLFDPIVSRRRNLGKLVPELRRRGDWRESRTGRLSMISLNAADVLAAVGAMADRGEYCYD